MLLINVMIMMGLSFRKCQLNEHIYITVEENINRSLTEIGRLVYFFSQFLEATSLSSLAAYIVKIVENLEIFAIFGKLFHCIGPRKDAACHCIDGINSSKSPAITCILCNFY